MSTACFDQAELLVQANEPPWEEADLLLRLRARARQVLGRP